MPKLGDVTLQQSPTSAQDTVSIQLALFQVSAHPFSQDELRIKKHRAGVHCWCSIVCSEIDVQSLRGHVWCITGSSGRSIVHQVSAEMLAWGM